MPRAAPGIQPQLDFQGAQREGHLVKLALQPDSAVFAHGPFQPLIEEWLEVVHFTPLAQRRGRLLITIFGALAGGTVGPLMIDGLDPEGEFGIEFLQAVGGVAFPTATWFQSLAEWFGSGARICLCSNYDRVSRAAAVRPTGRRQVAVSVDEGFALIGVELAGQAAGVKWLP